MKHIITMEFVSSKRRGFLFGDDAPDEEVAAFTGYPRDKPQKIKH